MKLIARRSFNHIFCLLHYALCPMHYAHCPMQVGYAVAHKKNATLVTIFPASFGVAPLKWEQHF